MTDQARSQPQQISDFWTKSLAENVARVEAFSAEVEKLQEKTAAQATANFDEVARLAKESINYTNELATAWRKLWLDGTKRAAEMMATPKV